MAVTGASGFIGRHVVAEAQGRGHEVVAMAGPQHGGNGAMLEFGIEKLFRDAAIFLHMDASVDVSRMKIIKNMFPATAGKYAGPEN